MNSKNIFGLKNLSNKSIIEEIRVKFLLEAESYPHLYHEIDVKRCRSEDWQIERYVIEKGSPNQAFNALVKTMVWKNHTGLHDRSRKYFPKEMVEIIGQQKPSFDKEGNICYWSHTPLFKRCEEFDQLFIQYSLYCLEKVDREVGNEGFISAINWKGFSYSNFDASMYKFNMAFHDHYPQILKLSCIFDMPWLLTPVCKTFISVSPARNKVKLLKKNQLKKYIDIDDNDIPICFGGKREKVLIESKEMQPLYKCKHLGLTLDQIEKFYVICGQLNIHC